MKLKELIRFTTFSGLLIAHSSFAQHPVPSEEALEKAYPKQSTFSPYVDRNFPTQVYWGDTHLHTGMSLDAGSFGARLMPDDAYRFAKGEQLTSSTGIKTRLSRPLDFLVVADHSDNMGFFPALSGGDPKMLADPTGRKWYDMIKAGGQEGVKAAVEIVQSLTTNSFPEPLYLAPGTSGYRDAWELTMEAAEHHNEPGKFTAFIGYEWTSTDKGMNLHRVLIYRDDSTKASQMEPYTTLPPWGSPDPVKLWEWMASYEEKTGGDILAIAHNGNMSNGVMFPQDKTIYGHRVNRAYAESRIRWEPLYEITQIKGDGEAHPYLSPNDLSELKTDDMLEGEYGRTALQIGLEIEDRVGVNPYKFGFIGATDSHTGLAPAQEDNFFGKHSGGEPSPERVHHPMAKIGDNEYPGWSMAASGYQGVWATENTREALFDAMMRKETYATTGSRMLVRFFGGWDFEEQDALNRLPANVGYLKGVPMGGDLSNRPEGKAPNFLIAALRDPMSGNLDRIQVVKGWLDKKGKRQEKIYNVAWSGDRALDENGNLPPVGNTVNVAEATWTNTIGDPELITVWTDPDFDPDVPAVYYVRVLEIPTPRWTAYEAKRFDIKMPSDEVEMTTQERAYTSPIWYAP